jgi:endonuclease IV
LEEPSCQTVRMCLDFSHFWQIGGQASSSHSQYKMWCQKHVLSKCERKFFHIWKKVEGYLEQVENVRPLHFFCHFFCSWNELYGLQLQMKCDQITSLLWIDEAKANIKPIYECRCNEKL